MWYGAVWAPPQMVAQRRKRFCTYKNIAMTDDESCYNLRHGRGHFKGLQIPVGALVDFMPQNDVKIESLW